MVQALPSALPSTQNRQPAAAALVALRPGTTTVGPYLP
jgi:hypothetical protein